MQKIMLSVAIYRNIDFKYYVRHLDSIGGLLCDHIVHVKGGYHIRISYNIAAY